MSDILNWLNSATGIITTIVAFMAAILLFIENSKKIVFNPLTKLGKILFGWMSKDQSKELKEIRNEINQFVERSDKRDEEIFGLIHGLTTTVKENECDRIRSEIFMYGRMARNHQSIGDEEWRHIQDIYYKYHEVLHGNGQVTEEYSFIKDYYYKQFEGEEL